MEKPKFYRFCEKGLFFAVCAATVVIFLLNILYNTWVVMDGNEIVKTPFEPVQGLILLCVAVFAMLAAAYCRNMLGKINEKAVFAVMMGLSLLWMLYLILNVDDTLRADAEMVRVAAMGMLDGDYASFAKDGYMTQYPHQIGLMLYDTILLLISRSGWIFFAANALFVCGINYLMWKISDAMFASKSINILVILLTHLFLPQSFFILFAYGLIPGLFFAVAAFYQTLKFAKNYKVRNLVGLALCIAAAVLLKKNYMIAGLAIVIYLLLKLMPKDRNRKAWIAIAAVLVGMFAPNHFLKLYYENKTGGELDGGMPSVLWVAMGTDMGNSRRGAPGSYNGVHVAAYKMAGYDTKKAAEYGWTGVEYNLKKMVKQPLRALKFFKEKTTYQWTDPMYQSVWSGPLEHTEQYTHTDLLRSIYNGGTAEKMVCAFSKLVTILIWLGFCAFLFLRKRRCEEWILFGLFFIGGFVFQSFWEGKSQYIYPYVFCLIPMAMCGFVQAAKKLQKFLPGERKHEK